MQNAMIKAFELKYKDNKEESVRKREQIRNMSKDINRLEDFLRDSGLISFIERY